MAVFLDTADSLSTDAQAIELNAVGFCVASHALLRGVNVRFLPGQISVILGQNGAGKTTLLRLLAKEILPSDGRIMWAGRDLTHHSLSSLALDRGVLEQTVDVAFSLTVEQVVSLGAEVGADVGANFALHVDTKARLVARVEAALTACDLQYLRQRDVLTLSGGEQKRTQLARVLAQIWPENDQQPNAFAGKWLFLDEWTAGLDLKHQLCLGTQMQGWVKKGLGIVMSLHDLNYAAQLAHTCVLLKKGEVLQAGTLAETFKLPLLNEALDAVLRIEKDPITQKPWVLPGL
ncbi:ATP-binding cassette domain-containing protein [Thiomicrorhabdus aquaedulcis]|uniref:ATP-binding cassette domain-containing protein n=1 Tax=Thiomicrorhabdus aquaedulcis TaxID=2211106 RepID=UPI000FD9D7BA|nr:ATP-binding cassette domain-containing protein [Thiomicrorhabdus aquaedulcis]